MIYSGLWTVDCGQLGARGESPAFGRCSSTRCFRSGHSTVHSPLNKEAFIEDLP